MKVRGEWARVQAPVSQEHFTVMLKEAEQAVERLKGFNPMPDATPQYFSPDGPYCSDEHTPRGVERTVKRLGWNIGIMTLCEDGKLYASRWGKCLHDGCDVRPLGLYLATHEQLRYQRDEGVAEVEQDFVMTVLQGLGMLP